MRPSPLSISLNTMLLAGLIGVASGRAAAEDHMATDDTPGRASTGQERAPFMGPRDQRVGQSPRPAFHSLGPLAIEQPSEAPVVRDDAVEEVLTVEPDDIATRTKVVTAPIDHDVVEVEDDDRLVGEREVEVEGVDGTRAIRLKRVVVNGKASDWEVVADRVTAEPTDEMIAVGTLEPEPEPEPAPETDVASESYGVWDQLAQCESNGNWSISTGNGYYGGLQFNLDTWQSNGGQGMPHENSREEQIRVATQLRDAVGGYGPWPSCSAQLGLPQ